MAIQSYGTWGDTYTPPARTWTLLHEGGPADGVRLTTEAPRPPQARWYAPARDRRGRRVQLARYTLHRPVELNVMAYRYCGVDERTGPQPGRKESPAWSW